MLSAWSGYFCSDVDNSPYFDRATIKYTIKYNIIRITRHNKNAETVFIFIGKFSYLKYDRLFGPDLLRGFVAVLQVKTVLRAIISNLHFS